MRTSNEQDSALAAVTSAKQAYDKRMQELEAELKVRKQDEKRTVIAAIEHAEGLGVSQNAIAVRGMQYSGPTALKVFRSGYHTASLGTQAGESASSVSGQAAARPDGLNYRLTNQNQMLINYVFTDDAGLEYDVQLADYRAYRAGMHSEFWDSPDAEAIEKFLESKHGPIQWED